MTDEIQTVDAIEIEIPDAEHYIVVNGVKVQQQNEIAFSDLSPSNRIIRRKKNKIFSKKCLYYSTFILGVFGFFALITYVPNSNRNYVIQNITLDN